MKSGYGFMVFLSSMELCGFVPLDWNLLFPAARATESHLN